MPWEILQIWVQLLYALVQFFLMFLVLRMYRMAQIRRKSPDMPYVFLRYQAKKLLATKSEEKRAWLEDLEQETSELICSELELNFLSSEEELAQIQTKECKLRVKLLNIWKLLQLKIPKGVFSGDNISLQALMFELESGLIRRPSDLLGRRRASRLKTILYKGINPTGSLEKKSSFEWLKALMIKLKILIFRIPVIHCLLNKKFIMMMVFMKTVVCTLVFHCYDYYTDSVVIYQYYNISNSQIIRSKLTYGQIIKFDGWSGENLDRIPDLDDSAPSSEIGSLILRNVFYLISFLSFLLIAVACVSVILIIPSIPSLYSLFHTSLKMRSSFTEKRNRLKEANILTRFNFARSEAGTESSMQLIFQMATYFAVVWVLAWVSKLVPRETETIFKISNLWPSFASSVLSISLGQFKARMVLHEFSTDYHKKMVYLMACILNTLFVSTVWVSIVVAIFDCSNFGGFDLTTGGGIELPDGRFMSKLVKLGWIQAFLFVIIIPSCTSILQLPTSLVHLDIASPKSEEYLRCLIKQFFFLAILYTYNAVLNILLLEFAQDSLGPSIVEMESKFANLTAPAGFGTEAILTPSNATEDLARRNFVIGSSILMPLCFLGSFLMLRIYFSGHTMNMKYIKNKHIKKTYKCVNLLPLKKCSLYNLLERCWPARAACEETGFWVDLPDLVADDIHCAKNHFVAEKKIDQELLDSVLLSLPCWQGKINIL